MNRSRVRFDFDSSSTSHNSSVKKITVDPTDELSVNSEQPYLTRRQLEADALRIDKKSYSSKDEPDTSKTQSWFARIFDKSRELRLPTVESIQNFFSIRRNKFFNDDKEIATTGHYHESNIISYPIYRDNTSSSHMSGTSMEAKSLSGNTYHSILWEEMYLEPNTNDELLNHGTSNGQANKTFNLRAWLHSLSLDLSTRKGQLVMELIAMLQIALSIVSFQVLCIFQKQCHLVSKQDVAVLTPIYMQSIILILACMHVTVSPLILFWFVPFLSETRSESRYLLDWARPCIVAYFLCCSLLHAVVGFIKCHVMIHGKKFYTEVIVKQLRLGSTKNSDPLTSVAQYHGLNDASIFCYGLTNSSTVIQRQVEKLASKQMTNEWSRLLLNCGQVVMNLMIAILLIFAWRNARGNRGMKEEEEDEEEEKTVHEKV